MKNYFHFTFKLFKYLKFCHEFFDLVGKRFNKKAKVNFKIYGVICWKINNNNSDIVRYPKT